jgi:predicted phosphodiesterase
MSDLHFEMRADGGAELIRELDPTGVDVLVMAGDITMARHYADLESVFKPLVRKYRHILYVPGNHEYYKSSPREVGAQPGEADEGVARGGDPRERYRRDRRSAVHRGLDVVSPRPNSGTE